MKAIYINIDPYIQAVADWLNAGKPGTAPKFDPLPLAVTIPLGESAALFCPIAASDDPLNVTIGDAYIEYSLTIIGDPIATGVTPGLSTIDPTQEVLVKAVSGSTVSTSLVMGADGDEIVVPFTVLVRREAASGPVDLVDFTPSSGGELTAAAINTALGGTGAVEGSPLKGVSLTDATGAPAPSAADIKTALVAAGSGALEGVSLDGMNLSEDGTIYGSINGSPASMALTELGDGETVGGFIGWPTTPSN